MSLNSTPVANRIHIGFFGRRNAGKSSLVNAVLDQDIAVVSDIKGTTTDPVTKTMELSTLGPVVMIDTPGFDDEGDLGEKRMKKTTNVLNKTDIAVLVVDSTLGMTAEDADFLELVKKKSLEYIVVFNKCDESDINTDVENSLCVSAATGRNIDLLKRKLAGMAPRDSGRRLAADIVSPGQLVVLVTPIDASAPKGRLILPQQQVIRDILDCGAAVVVTRETELEKTLKGLAEPPSLVITDSQVFGFVAETIPRDVPLTSFSILMSRYKGFLRTAVEGIGAIDKLRDGDTVLISEGCTHHRQCLDIGTVKIPRWLREHTGRRLKIKTSTGTGFPEDLSEFSLIIHCGGCMLSEREVAYRRKCAGDAGIPFTNYGTFIAFVNGILDRSLAPLNNNF